MPLAENALFKSHGVIYLPPLLSTLPDELSTDVRNGSGFLSRQRVSTFNDGFCKTTDSSLFSTKELLSFLAYFCACGHMASCLAHVTPLRTTQLRAICILVVTIYSSLDQGSATCVTDLVLVAEAPLPSVTCKLCCQ